MRKREGAKPKKQRNYRIDEQFAEYFDTYCDDHDLMRDRTAERALRLFLDAAVKTNTQQFIVELSDDAAAALHAYRKVFIADRNDLLESALLEFIERQLEKYPEN